MDDNNGECNNPDEFNDLTLEEQNFLLEWIASNITQIKSFNDKSASYELKKIYQMDNDNFYVTNGQFKGAMVKAGFKVKDSSDKNWVFNISSKSKCFDVFK